MCTATWITRSDGYELFFNRDELRVRQPALPPRVESRGGVAYLAPTDADAGGTWLAVNERGLTLGLLNGAPPRSPLSGPYTSRGELVRSLADAGDWEEVAARLEKGGSAPSLASFRPFTLLVLDPSGPIRRATWDGERLSLDADEPAQPLASSSLDHSGAAQARRELWRERFADRAAGSPETHLAFRASHLPEKGTYSPCMHRPDAVTVSSCHVTVTADRVRLTYLAGPPCGEGARARGRAGELGARSLPSRHRRR